jgi:predicted RNase H-like nuclease (RuvC/YqgF family)
MNAANHLLNIEGIDFTTLASATFIHPEKTNAVHFKRIQHFRSLLTRPSEEGEAKDADERRRIATVEEKTNQHPNPIVMLQNEVTQLPTDSGRLVGEVSALRSATVGIQTLSEEVSALKTQIGQKQNDPIVEQLSTELSELRKDVYLLQFLFNDE